MLPMALPLLAAALIPSSPDLGKAEGQCRPNERGPAFIVEPVGLKDRTGTFKLEVYPANAQDFFADDNILVSEGKTVEFHRELTRGAQKFSLRIDP
ncbi:hypothetical protein ACFFF8_17500, partial [Novosphingobium clariflavum]